MPHTPHPLVARVTIVTLEGKSYPIKSLLPGTIVDVAVWCLILIATICVVWRWTANGRQWQLRTLFGVFVVVASLLGWWKYERDLFASRLLGDSVELTESDVTELTVASELPLLALLRFPSHVFIPVFFGLACGIYWIVWIGGVIVTRVIRMGSHAAAP